MAKILNITNGDVAINIMKEAEIKGDFLGWQDFLHQGPVPRQFSLQQLSKLRANFIYKQGLGKLDDIQKSFKQRDTKLASFQTYEKVTLWFEHDLYDQLQLLQVLAWFKINIIKETKLTLICTKNYLGECSTSEIEKLLRYEHRVMPEHLNLAEEAWFAFSEPNPKAWFKILDKNTYLLPFLQNAIKRMLEEYPNTKNGLSRSEHQALLVISKGISQPREIFKDCQSYEEAKFMGNVIFWKILDDFIQYKLINSKEHGQELTITILGEKILNGKINWLSIKTINCWIGGVHLTPDNLWCWDIKKKNIKKYYYASALSSLLSVKKKLTKN
jgi:hypothetical protein